ncbi:sugar ABC transporter permease [Corynebacterium afermentans]|uniref:carbohydrate ABC transporter permease n=1 Tax=Corynebacterium afermentans TaxID=38286 RepID=UPI002572C736|nr:sugar ABC transporter permease [Corynebacterium afermentans]MCG7291493.1 sugar ABC transporter permease [Corynebacterium afermentans]
MTSSAQTTTQREEIKPTKVRGPVLTFWLFLSPAILLLLVTRLWPVLEAFMISLSDPVSGSRFGAYAALFTSESFLNSLKVTLWFNLIINPLQLLISLGLAVLMSQNLPAQKIMRLMIFLPAAIPQSVSTVVWGIMMRPDDGLLNSMLGLFRIENQPFLISPELALYSIMVIASWVGVGYWMMFLIAGLNDIPVSVIEASKLDGAGWWQRFFSIILPMMTRPLAFVLVATTVANFLLFVPVQVLTQGGPEGSTDLLMHQIYRQAYTYSDMPFAMAQVIVLTVITLAIVVLQFRFLRPRA